MVRKNAGIDAPSFRFERKFAKSHICIHKIYDDLNAQYTSCLSRDAT